MCGIAGIIATTSTLPEHAVGTVANMTAALRHRGPDADGFFHDEHCALGMRRLSIIDLAAGNQPIFNETGDVLVFQNGELYNYRELRDELEKAGHRFATQSDTEVLVHLYEAYGEQMFERIKGMFALCIYDVRQQRFLLARDRFGEKPLHYHLGGGLFSFSSELTSLLENKAIPRKLNLEALGYYLRTSLIPAPITLFQDVLTLPPGHFVRIENGSVDVVQYFDPSHRNAPLISDEQEAKQLLEPLLQQAVQRQLVSDVPVGAFLSGGIDSSSVVALMQHQSSKPIQTFNVRFEDAAYDESAIARKVAAHCGTDHHELVVPRQEFDESIFWTIIDHVGQPFRDTSAIPTFLVSKAIGQHVKVALSGDGGDELFAGYSLFQWYSKITGLQSIPRLVRSLAEGVAGLAQHVPGLQSASKIRQVKRALGASLLDVDDIAIALNEMFTEQEMAALSAHHFGNISATTFKRLKHTPNKDLRRSNLRKIMQYRVQHTLPENMLVKVDRMSMANSLEVRAPFLDADLFAASNQLSDDLLLRNGTGKHILRECMKPHLPSEVFDHPKQGFNMPLHSYQNDTYKQLAKRLLFDENPLPELFDSKTLQHLLNQGIQMQRDNSNISVFRASHQLWMMMQLFGWAQRFKVEMP